ncbi:hypothetical protein EV175_000309 [Coemansia sp. RSA 1933]|nr:hypothetical protein EV175_000309 [Coemansia sp. RSA 1933]
MNLIVIFGLVSIVAQAGLGRKCRIRPQTIAPTPMDTSSDYDVPSETPMATQLSETSYAVYITSTSTTNGMNNAVASPSTEHTLSVHRTSSTTSPGASPTTASSTSYYQITLAALNKAVPARAADTSCSSVTYTSECATNSRAVTAINNALTKYKISGRGEAVAVIALMAYESDSWQYNINHFPGRAGQGTRNMQMYNFNSEYAKLLYPTKAAAALASGTSGSDAQENAVRALVLDDNDSFGSGFWYLVNHASSYYNNANKLRSGNSADFKDYVVTGVGAGWTDDHTAIPSRAGTNPCNGAQYPDECASNARAAAAINNALTQYKITNRGEAVAVIATMMFESDYWLYNINHYPGTPGQGTRNMQHINFNVEYASQLHPSAVKTAAGTGTITTQEENNVLALVLNDDDSFGSGFWLLVNQAPSYHNNPEKLRNNNSADFKDYVVNGIGVGIDWTDERYIPWATINKVFS